MVKRLYGVLSHVSRSMSKSPLLFLPSLVAPNDIELDRLCSRFVLLPGLIWIEFATVGGFESWTGISIPNFSFNTASEGFLSSSVKTFQIRFLWYHTQYHLSRLGNLGAVLRRTSYMLYPKKLKVLYQINENSFSRSISF